MTPLTPEQERAAARLRAAGVDRPTMEQINWAASQADLPGEMVNPVTGVPIIQGVTYGGQPLTPQMRAGLANLGRAVAAALAPATDKPLPPDMRYRGTTDAQRKLTKSQRRNRRRRDRQNRKKGRQS